MNIEDPKPFGAVREPAEIAEHYFCVAFFGYFFISIAFYFFNCLNEGFAVGEAKK